MVRDTATTLTTALRGGSGLAPILVGLALLAGTSLTPSAAFAEGGYGRAASPPPYANATPRAHRCGPPRPGCHARAPYGGPPALVRAYLPRNDALPMYNEPPPRFPEH